MGCNGTSPTKNGFGLVVGIYVTKNTYETRFEEGIFTGIEWDMCTHAADSVKFGFVQIFFGRAKYHVISRNYVLSMTF